MNNREIKFKHIIITRFNLSQRWKKDKLGKNVLDNDWLIKRYKLFIQFCLPSIKSQQIQNFEWWVYFDSALPEKYKALNKQLNIDYENFKPRYEDSYDSFEINMPNNIKKQLVNKDIDYLISTRLDNDDMLAKDTVELIQKTNINSKKDKILELPIGYTLGINQNYIIKKVNSKLNPFISLIEKINVNEPIKTVYYNQHNKWTNVDNIELSSKAQWIQIIHDRNVSNSLIGDFTLALGISRRFEICNIERINIYWMGLIPLIKRKIKFILKM
tara:strand:+ start:3130 stop:3945 length:816 start_codon:yes stop_codon:yes gene_type:complete